jgi:hypothetical protein
LAVGKSVLADIAAGEKTGVSVMRDDEEYQDASGGELHTSPDLSCVCLTMQYSINFHFHFFVVILFSTPHIPSLFFFLFFPFFFSIFFYFSLFSLPLSSFFFSSLSPLSQADSGEMTRICSMTRRAHPRSPKVRTAHPLLSLPFMVCC